MHYINLQYTSEILMQKIKLYLFIIREILVNYIGYKLKIRSLFQRSKINNMSRSLEVDIYDKGIKHVKNINKHIEKYSLDIKHKGVFLEMGPGGSLLHGIHKILEGWINYIGIDAFPSQVWSEYPQLLYKELLTASPENLQEKIKETIHSSMQQKGPLFYFGEHGLDNEDFMEKYKEGSIDFIYSWGVLEHIEDPYEVFKKNYSLLSDNGYILHVIDPHPHIWDRFKEPYIFLTIPKWVWDLMYKGRGFINRIRASSYEKWALQAGFKVISNEKEVSKFNLDKFKDKICSSIKYEDTTDLKTDRLYLLLQK